jgi:hypothetical protein
LITQERAKSAQRVRKVRDSMQTNNKSEVARLMAQVAKEHE